MPISISRIAAGVMLIVFLGFQSCGSGRLSEIAEGSSRDLHERIEKGAYSDVYGLTTDNFRALNPEADFAAFMGGFSVAAGRCRSSVLRSRNVTFEPKVDVVQLVYARSCEKRNVVETLLWEISDDRARLSAFNYSLSAPRD